MGIVWIVAVEKWWKYISISRSTLDFESGGSLGVGGRVVPVPLSGTATSKYLFFVPRKNVCKFTDVAKICGQRSSP